MVNHAFIFLHTIISHFKIIQERSTHLLNYRNSLKVQCFQIRFPNSVAFASKLYEIYVHYMFQCSITLHLSHEFFVIFTELE